MSMFSTRLRHRVVGKAAGWLAACLLAATHLHAQPVGWTHAQPITLTEKSGSALSGYQVRLTLDTSGFAPDAADLRFGTDFAGTTLLDHWIESGAGTASTVVWVKVPNLPASGQTTIYRFGGNASATSTSTAAVFDHVDMQSNSATRQITGGTYSGVYDSQRGFRFRPNRDMLVTSLGKYEPNGTPREVMLYNAATQVKLVELTVPGAADTYSYQSLPQPLMLKPDTEYILVIHQGPSDGYYFQDFTSINPALTFLDMRFCNGCSKDTFPTNVLANKLYGYPDFQFRTRQESVVAPTVQYGVLGEYLAVTTSVTPAQGGTVTCAPDEAVLKGDDIVCMAAAAAHYVFQSLGGDCATPSASTIVSGNACTLKGVSAAKHISANFVPAPIDGQCGAANGQPTAVAPATTLLCQQGTASGVLAGSPWTWTCAGQYGGQGASCSAPNASAGGGAARVDAPTNGWRVASASFSGALPAPLPAGVTLPQGLLSLNLEGGTPGSSTTVTITYSDPLPAGAQYWKYGKEKPSDADHWFRYPNAVIGTHTVTLTLTDGQPGDLDLTLDGFIRDPGGPAAVSVSAVPVLDGLWRWVLLLCVPLVGWVCRRRHRCTPV